MATTLNAPFTSEIWHLSIEDLLEPLTAMPRLGGPGPFVINLSASSAPLGQPASKWAPPESVYVYQIQRMEDRRPRYRLRLGPFLTEDEADAVLTRVRDFYPSALTATAEADDLKAITALKPKSATGPVAGASAAAPAAAGQTAPTPSAAMPVRAAAAPRAAAPAPRAAAPAPVVVWPTAPVAPAASSIPVLSDCVEPVKRLAAKISAPPNAVLPPAVVSPAAKPVPPVLRPAVAAVSHAATPARPADAIRKPDFEATQTLRPLTPAELQDAGARWYVIQLSRSEQSFDPESLPNLDIFSEYRLYSVAGIDQGRIMHALRLGFFTEEAAAAAVASYLGGFYDKPTVKRISVAERERFRDQRVEARKDIGATGRHAVIEITGERHVRDRGPRLATVTPLTPPAPVSQAAAKPVGRGA